MPKIYEYLGIVIFFYSNEHEPIHVHASYQGHGAKAEFIIENGRIKEIIIKPERGRRLLTPNKLQDFSEFLNHFGEEIVQKWIDYFVLHKRITFEKIDRKLK